MNTSNKPQTSFIMSDGDVVITPNWLDNREIELFAAPEIRIDSQTWVSARYKGTNEAAAMSRYTVDRCGTINVNGLFTSTSAGNARITGTATNGKTATCDINIIDKTKIGINNNNSGASLSSTEAWKGETININAGSRAGYKFAGWTMGSQSDGVFGNASLPQTTFRVGRTGTVALTANWVIDAPTYNVSMENSYGYPMSGAGNYQVGERVTISVTPTGSNPRTFKGWDRDPDPNYGQPQLANPQSATTTFVMPSKPVYLYAVFY